MNEKSFLGDDYLLSSSLAKKLYNDYADNVLYARNRGYNITPIESLKMKEVELKMLEESARTTNGKRSITQLNTEAQTKQTTGNDLLRND